MTCRIMQKLTAVLWLIAAAGSPAVGQSTSGNEPVNALAVKQQMILDRLTRLEDQMFRLREKLRAGHRRHPLVGQEQCHCCIAALQFDESFECLGTGRSRQHPVLLLILSTDIPADGGCHRRFVVHTQNHRLGHGMLTPKLGRPSRAGPSCTRRRDCSGPPCPAVRR